jgi:hypothetical protein
MNERIRELKDKIWTEEYWSNPNTDKLLPAQLNRFADMIVRECADQFKLVHTDEQYQRRIDKTILKHFGLYE